MNDIFQANLKALSISNPQLYSRFQNVVPSKRYSFIQSRGGEKVPANPQPLHSTVDPMREAARLVGQSLAASDTDADAPFAVFLGLGGGFAPKAALQMPNTRAVAVIDFCIEDIACLFSEIDYTSLFNNDKFFLLIDPSPEQIKKFIIDNYNPSLYGDFRTIPLRTRTEQDTEKFGETVSFIQEAIEAVSRDYSVQAHFGKRWFSNIIRNIKKTQDCQEFFWQDKKNFFAKEAAIVAAGPSLDTQIESLGELKSRGGFVISADTALPVLLHNKIIPDAVMSIDCQHISYYHFLCCGDLGDIPLILDIASPPLIAGFSSTPIFFSSGHPLALYLSAAWRPFVNIDTSGGNVTYACLSLAENLGAKHISLFGADFSYVDSRTYARGTYIYPYFTQRQNRLSPLEAKFSAFLYRSPFLPREDVHAQYSETSQLRFYRNKLEEKASLMTAEISRARGLGAPINLQKTTSAKAAETLPYSPAQKAEKSGEAFLEQYRNEIDRLPEASEGENYLKKLDLNQRRIFTTLLPYAAAIRKREPMLKFAQLIKETKHRCTEEIVKALLR